MSDLTIGRWKISKGKGNRHYINCLNKGDNCEGVMHPEQLAEPNGCGVYGFEELQDLALAILRFEKEQLHKSSIAGKLKSLNSSLDRGE